MSITYFLSFATLTNKNMPVERATPYRILNANSKHQTSRNTENRLLLTQIDWLSFMHGKHWNAHFCLPFLFQHELLGVECDQFVETAQVQTEYRNICAEAKQFIYVPVLYKSNDATYIDRRWAVVIDLILFCGKRFHGSRGWLILTLFHLAGSTWNHF